MIVITGAGIISAIGNNKEAVWSSLKGECCGISAPRYLETSHSQLPVGEVKMSNRELAELCGVSQEECTRTALLGIVALREALQQAGIGRDETASMALISGTTVGSMDKTERDYLSCGSVDVIGDCETSTLQMASKVGDFGYITTCSTACSSAANAFIVGAELIRSGLYSKVAVGGTEALSKFHLNGFNSLMILDKEICRPFDATRAGLNLGEGAAFMVLETLESAMERGATPLALLSGWGNACDAFHQTATSAQGEGGYLSMSKALECAKLTPAEIDYINAHGTATPNNDSSEANAIKRLFGEQVPLFSSTKSLTGHTTSASGSIEMVISLLAMQHSFVPANHNWSKGMDEGLTPVAKGMEGVELNHILCNSFGFGGNDTTLILSKFNTSTSIKDSYTCKRLEQIRAHIVCAVDYNSIAPEEMPAIPPMAARRMKGMLKRALVTSLVALNRAGNPLPDAIITGTGLGCVEETLAFLNEIYRNGEQLLKPTCFMNSTHNTIGSLIAIHTGNHGYNNTYSQGGDSLYSALLDALLQISLGEIESALVGWHESAGERSVALYVTKYSENGGEELRMDNIKEICGRYCL